MILGVPSAQQWERVKVINKLVRRLECLSACACDGAGVSVSEKVLKGCKDCERWWALCSQITASDKARGEALTLSLSLIGSLSEMRGRFSLMQRTFQRQVSSHAPQCGGGGGGCGGGGVCLSQAYRPDLNRR